MQTGGYPRLPEQGTPPYDDSDGDCAGPVALLSLRVHDDGSRPHDMRHCTLEALPCDCVDVS